MQHTPKLYSAEEAADMLGLKRRKIWGLAASGRLEHHRIDHQLRFTLEQIDSFIASTLVPATTSREIGPPFDVRRMQAASGTRPNRRKTPVQPPSSKRPQQPRPEECG